MKFTKKTQVSEKAIESQDRRIQKERRSFLDLVAKSGVASTTLRYSSLLGGVMTARYAQAQESPKRVVYCYVHSGSPDNWRPRDASTMSSSSIHYAGVADICNFRGVDTEVGGHGGARQALGGDYSPGTTADGKLGPILGPSSYFSTIFLGSNATESGLGAGVVIGEGAPIDDPRQALGKFFGALPEVGSDDTYQKAFDAQKRAIDSVKNRLSSAEYERLEKHFSAIEAIERRIADQATAEAPDLDACRPTLPGSYDDSTNAGMVAHAKLQADIIVAAFKCDLTRVGVLQIGTHNGAGWTYRGFDGHGAAHSGGAGVWNAMMTEKFQVPAYLLDQLRNTNDSNGNRLIDSTVFCQVSCFGNGISHASTNAPFLLATGLPGFRNGFSSKATGATSRDFHFEVAKGLGAQVDFKGATGGDVDLLTS